MSVFSEEQVTPVEQSEQVSAFEEPTSPSVLGDLVGTGIWQCRAPCGGLGGIKPDGGRLVAIAGRWGRTLKRSERYNLLNPQSCHIRARFREQLGLAAQGRNQMAAIFVLMGGIVGCISAIVSFTVLKTSLLMALAIWSGVGLLAAFVVFAIALAPRQASSSQPDIQAA